MTIRKSGLKSIAASALVLALGCNGAVDDVGDADESVTPEIDPVTQDLRLNGTSTTLSEPTSFRTTSAAEAAINTVWGAPAKGKPASYVVFRDGKTLARSTKLAYTFSDLKCGTTYNLEVAAVDSSLKVSPHAALKATTAACTSTPTTPTTPTTPAAPAVTGYAAAVLADKPIAYWRFDDKTATDVAGKHNGSFAGNPTFANGAVNFDGVDDAMTTNDAADLRLDGSFSIEFMAKLNGNNGAWPSILSKGASGPGTSGYLVYYSSQYNQPTFKRAGVDGLYASSKGVLTGQLKHFAFTYDSASATARWYVAGELDSTYTNIRFPANTDASQFAIGRGDAFGSDTLDEVALYNTVLAADHIKAHFSASGLSTVTTPSTPAPSTPAPTTPAPTTPAPTTPAPTTPAPTTPSATTGIGGMKFPVGVCAYGADSDFQKIAAAGMKTVRMDHPSAAMIEKARTFGIEVLPLASYGYTDLSADGDDMSPPTANNRAEWARRMVDTWRSMKNPPKVIEVWNEPYNNQFWGGKPNPSEYLELFKAFAKEAWAVWPNVTLLVAGDTGQGDYPTFRRDLLAADGAGFLNDARIFPTAHVYVEARSPSDATGNKCAYDLNRYECTYADFKAHGHKNPMVWVTEYGWESNTAAPGWASWSTVSEQQQAQFTVQSLEMMRSSGIVAATYSFLFNQGNNWNYNWVRPDYSNKPVYDQVKSWNASHQ